MPDPWRRLSISAAVAGLAVSVIAAPSSGAAMAGTTTGASRLSDAAAVSPHTKSNYLAGYRATETAGHVEGVVVKAVTVPDATCPGGHFRGIALGAGSEPVVGQPEYFGGIVIACFFGQAQYTLDARAGNVDNQTGVEPGDQVQVVISLTCDAYPTCHVFSSATSLDTDMTARAESDVMLTSDSAEFGAFPHFAEGSARPAPVPVFGLVRLKDCLFDQHLLSKSAERLTRVNHGAVQLKASRIRVGSFTLRNLAR